MTPVQRKRTIRFIKYLEKLSSKSFDIRTVCHHTEPVNKENFAKSLKNHDCGTVACAIGHLPLFSPTVFEYKYSEHAKEFRVRNKNSKEEYWGDHAKTYFGLTLNDTLDVFTFEGYSGYHGEEITPKMVAHMLRQVISYHS